MQSAAASAQRWRRPACCLRSLRWRLVLRLQLLLLLHCPQVLRLRLLLVLRLLLLLHQQPQLLPWRCRRCRLATMLQAQQMRAP